MAAPTPISPERRGMYLLGQVLSGVGFAMFLSTFVVFLSTFGNFDAFFWSAKTCGFLAIGGMALIIAGQVVRGVAARGVAGSGLVLDPEQARRDLQPWSQMAGGLVNDALGEVDAAQALTAAATATGGPPGAAREVVKVRCRGCEALNDEQAKFCDQCGAAL